MEIHLENIGKKFRKSWIFEDVQHLFGEGEAHVILGPNGSGKSTILQIISGLILPTKGQIVHKINSTTIEPDQVYQYISMAAPYMELLETLTLKEMLNVHTKFKKLIENISTETFFDLTYLREHQDKQISDFSSGMKQRLKLGLAILSDTQLLLLDEPLINLDERGKKMYLELIEKYGNKRNIVVCSNHQRDEYDFCSKTLKLSDR